MLVCGDIDESIRCYIRELFNGTSFYDYVLSQRMGYYYVNQNWEFYKVVFGTQCLFIKSLCIIWKYIHECNSGTVAWVRKSRSLLFYKLLKFLLMLKESSCLFTLRIRKKTFIQLITDLQKKFNQYIHPIIHNRVNFVAKTRDTCRGASLKIWLNYRVCIHSKGRISIKKRPTSIPREIKSRQRLPPPPRSSITHTNPLFILPATAY